MQTDRETLLCRYQYDPLDRLVDYTQSAKANTRRFYLKDRLVTEIQDEIQRSVMQHEDQLLAQQQRQTGALEVSLFATDQQHSVLNVPDASRPRPIAYTPYGNRPLESGLLSLLGFNGGRPDPVTGHYLLGNGYRAFNAVLMRFNSPDSWSPFGEGGMNAYAYCVGDPVNRRDPSGHTPTWLKALLRSTGLMRDRTRPFVSVTPISRGPFRNPMANLLPPASNTKTPAWTTRDGLDFAGTEARHPGTPSPAASQESLINYSGDSPRASQADIQPLRAEQSTPTNTPPRRRRGGDVFDPMSSDISELRARHGNGDITASQAGLISDPPPGYLDPLPPPNYTGELPHYRQALVNERSLKNLAKRQSKIRRTLGSAN